jgi:predicted dienelactone hydrolase
VLAPTHADSLELRRARGERVTMGGTIGEFGRDPQVRLNRAADISFVIDSLGELPKQAPPLAGKLDAARVGVGGHSAGAMTALLIGGEHGDMAINGQGGPETRDMRDPRVQCILVLSGQGISGRRGALNENSWRDVTLPMMVMTGSLDESPRTGQTAQSRQDPYYYAPPGEKYLLFIEAATHMSFTGRIGGQNPDERYALLLNSALGLSREQTQQALSYDQAAIFSWVQMASLAFWDAQLKDDAQARRWLKSDAIARYSGGAVRYEWK